jgi:uncharacterized protein (TIGR00369 family)
MNSCPSLMDRLGMSIVSVDPEAGTIDVRFEVGEEFTNPAGNVQGEFLAAMLDETLGPALTATLAAGEFASTINFKVQFLSVAVPGRIQGTGRIVKRGQEIYYLSGELLQRDKLVATATAAAVIRKL